MAEYKCGTCSEPFPKLGLLSKHMWAEHPAKMKRARKKKAAAAAAIAESPASDAETSLLVSAVALFDQSIDQGVLAADSYARVGAYLVARYGAT